MFSDMDIGLEPPPQGKRPGKVLVIISTLYGGEIPYCVGIRGFVAASVCFDMCISHGRRESLVLQEWTRRQIRARR